jgi:hypothetical protein
MYAKTLSTLMVLGLIGIGTVQAGPVIGTAKARGDYSSNLGQSRSYSSQARSSYRYATPMVRTAPPAQYRQAAPPVAVAQAPAEGRRYSYAPQASQPATTAPCPAANSAAPEATRRYSYQPAPAVEPAPTHVDRQPGYVQGGGSSSRNRSGRDLWSLPKTDPRKYSSR